MKIIALLGLLLLATLNSASQNPDEYSISVHVSSSYLLPYNDNRLELKVAIDGKKYELREVGAGSNVLLAPGDYKAKLVKDEHKTSYESSQIYEFRFPDSKLKKFYVSGQAE